MLLAIDVAVLPPRAIASRAIELSAKLPPNESLGLVLGGDVLPHITLTQQFVACDELDKVLECIGSTVVGLEPLRLTVTGAGRGGHSVWMAIERSQQLADVHRRLMDTLRPFERVGGSEAAFVNHDARLRDVEWVANFRRNSSHEAFAPHITLGHASALPSVEHVACDATTIGACHLGRFCTCRRVLRQWDL